MLREATLGWRSQAGAQHPSPLLRALSLGVTKPDQSDLPISLRVVPGPARTNETRVFPVRESPGRGTPAGFAGGTGGSGWQSVAIWWERPRENGTSMEEMRAEMDSEPDARTHPSNPSNPAGLPEVSVA